MKSKKTLIRFTLFTGLGALVPGRWVADADEDDYEDDYREPVTLQEGIDQLEQGWEDAYVSVEGTPVSLIDDDDYRFDVGGIEIILDLWDLTDVVLPLGEVVLVTGELEFTDEDDAPGILYELDAEALYTPEGELIASLKDEDDYRDEDDDDDYIDDDDDARDDDEDDYIDDDDDARDDDDDDYIDDDDEARDDDDDDDDLRDDEVLSLEEAISRLEAGWDEAYISVEGVPVEMLDEDEYRFAIGDTEVVLDLWDESVVLTTGETIRVTGELEFADDDDAYGLVYELDAMFIEDLDGNRIGDED